jgi:hypothetical protein
MGHLDARRELASVRPHAEPEPDPLAQSPPTRKSVRNKWHTREAEIAAEQAAIADKAP